jgi:hypothetical protein
MRLKLSETHQLLAYAYEYVLGDNINTINKNHKNLFGASKEIGLEINVQKTKYMLLSCHQNAGQRCDIKIENRLFEHVSEFKYF